MDCSTDESGSDSEGGGSSSSSYSSLSDLVSERTPDVSPCKCRFDYERSLVTKLTLTGINRCCDPSCSDDVVEWT